MPQPIDADLSGKTCVVTGANTGIGKEIARGLARLGGRVVFACRSLERGQAALEEVRADTGNEALEVRALDLSQPASIQAFAAGLLADHPRLDVLVNNAGAWVTERQTNEEGLELTFATNALGPWRLTNLLEERLAASGSGRVVDVASKMARALDLDDLSFERRRYSGTDAYAQSKQANRMLAQARARRLRDRGLTVNALHPGVVATEIARNSGGLFGVAARAYFKLAGRSPAAGADTAVFLAASPEVAGITGGWWGDRVQRREKYTVRSQNEALWRRCAALSHPQPA